VVTEIATLDEILNAYAVQLGDDFTSYRNHTYRVANLCIAQSAAGAGQIEKIAVAAAFHDLGIWTDGTFDYLEPSARLAGAYLAGSAHADWEPEVRAMILNHHKVSPYRQDPQWLVEPFRRADWIDVTLGLITFGLPRRTIRALYEMWPSAGFHKRLIELEFGHLRKHPLNPLPMFRW
jgi:HD domain-containing protein